MPFDECPQTISRAPGTETIAASRTPPPELPRLFSPFIPVRETLGQSPHSISKRFYFSSISKPDALLFRIFGMNRQQSRSAQFWIFPAHWQQRPNPSQPSGGNELPSLFRGKFQGDLRILEINLERRHELAKPPLTRCKIHRTLQTEMAVSASVLQPNQTPGDCLN